MRLVPMISNVIQCNPANYINTDNTDINAEDLLDELHEADAMLDELLKGDISVEKACDNKLNQG